MTDRGVHQTDVADVPIADAPVESARRHGVDDHLPRFDIPALGLAGQPGGSGQRLHPLREGVVGREAGHPQPHAELGAQFAEDPLAVSHELRVGPFGPASSASRTRRPRTAARPRTSRRTMRPVAGRAWRAGLPWPRERAHGPIRPARGRSPSEALEEGVGEELGAVRRWDDAAAASESPLLPGRAADGETPTGMRPA